MKKSRAISKEQYRKINSYLIITIGVLVGACIFLGIMLILTNQVATSNATALEASYQKSYYNLVENINNAETEMSKVLLTDDDKYVGELLTKVSKNTHNAQNNLSLLPISINGIEESIKFINQLGGYCETLSKKITDNKSITPQEKETLQQLYNSLLDMKISLNKISNTMNNKYSILENSLNLEKDYNDFTLQLQAIHTNDVEYPTMIYDGPFADSQITQEIKALKNSTTVIDEERARELIAKLFDVDGEITYMGDTVHNFETFDFTFKTKSGNENFAQISKTEGHLITLAGQEQDREPAYDINEVMTRARSFIAKNGVGEVEVVWHDIIASNAYFNFAPIKNGVILYPDLIKVKCSLATSEILGYEARSYFINHIERTIPAFTISQAQAQTKIKSAYDIIGVRKVLAPIEFQEVLCYEFECFYDDTTYYIYVNGVTGSVVNILKVIQTNDGSKIM